MKTRSILALFLAIVMMMSLCSPVLAVNTKGVTFKAELDKSTIDMRSEDQTVTVTVDANMEITWDGIGFKAFYDSPLKLTNITNKEVTLTDGDIQVSLGSGDNGAGYQTEDCENSTITNICVLHFTIPANTPAGTYDLGIQQLEITSDYGEIWENSATAMTTITINTEDHTHVFDQEVATDAYKATDANCTEAATYYKSCDCGGKGTETFSNGEALGHTEGTEFKSDKDNHWHTCSVDGCGVVIESSKAPHADDNKDGECDLCQYNVGVSSDPAQPGGDGMEQDDIKPSADDTPPYSMLWLWVVLLVVVGGGVVVICRSR